MFHFYHLGILQSHTITPSRRGGISSYLPTNSAFLMFLISSYKSVFSWVVIYPQSEEVFLAFLIEQVYWQHILSAFVYLKMPLFHFHLVGLVSFKSTLLWYNWVHVLMSLGDAPWGQDPWLILKGQQSTVIQKPNSKAKCLNLNLSSTVNYLGRCLSLSAPQFLHIPNEENINYLFQRIAADIMWNTM